MIVGSGRRGWGRVVVVVLWVGEVMGGGGWGVVLRILFFEMCCLRGGSWRWVDRHGVLGKMSGLLTKNVEPSSTPGALGLWGLGVWLLCGLAPSPGE